MTDDTRLEIPSSFWELLTSSNRNLQALAKRLEALPREELIQYASTYREAAMELCDYWEGPTVDDVSFSEDDTEDLCHWIVAQGPSLYGSALGLRGALDPIVRRYWASEEGEDPEYPAWSTDVENPAYLGSQHPAHIAHAVFEARFDEALDEYLD